MDKCKLTFGDTLRTSVVILSLLQQCWPSEAAVTAVASTVPAVGVADNQGLQHSRLSNPEAIAVGCYARAMVSKRSNRCLTDPSSKSEEAASRALPVRPAF